MADNSKIEWTDATWNPITGCTIVSPGCTNCYAMKLAGTRMKNHWSRKGLTQPSKAGPVWNGKVRFNEQWLEQPLHWRKPRKIFVCAHGDLFHEDVPKEWIDKVFAVMVLAPQHTFQVLTKRADRMLNYFVRDADDGFMPAEARIEHRAKQIARQRGAPIPIGKTLIGTIPWPNVHLGVSIEDQTRADERTPLLLNTPAAVRFISAEPLLGPIDLTFWMRRFNREEMGMADDPLAAAMLNEGIEGGNAWAKPAIHQVIVGGESGLNARPMHPNWARSLRDQCKASCVPFMFKQWGEFVGGGRMSNGWFYFHNNSGGPGCNHDWGDGCGSDRVGKKAAGRLLDGREWNGVVSRLPEDEAKTKWCP